MGRGFVQVTWWQHGGCRGWEAVPSSLSVGAEDAPGRNSWRHPGLLRLRPNPGAEDAPG